MTSPSPADCIGQYIKLRNFIAAKEAAMDAELRPYRQSMEAIENFMLGELNKLGTTATDKASIATPQGTCFRKTLMSVKVVDREEFMDFVFDGRREGFITNAVSKEAVQEFMDEHKAAPPGIETAKIHKIQFNSPKG